MNRKVNIFQDSKSIRNTIAKTLGYKTPQEYSWYTENIFFETFFYLSKRFGMPKVWDEYKQAGVWSFSVKHYTITVEMNSSWVIFMIFGDKKHYRHSTFPTYWIKYNREANKKRELLLDTMKDSEDRTKYEKDKLQQLLNEFQEEKKIPDNITVEDFHEIYGSEFFRKIDEFNNKVIGVNSKDFDLNVEYMNSKKRHALKTMEQFIKNMLTPIYVRDVPYNIKGRMTDNEAHYLNQNINNIKIDYISD
ncbi:hypothetical protein [Myroides odoratus]|uniref:hypothetical protein n=1 Tax=Myroides odoratus TaxID=256 RepID=UPI000765DBB7|nr:hypothetical protein [Myroides odoratus]